MRFVYYPDPSCLLPGIYTVTAYFRGNNITCTKKYGSLTVYPYTYTFTLIDGRNRAL